MSEKPLILIVDDEIMNIRVLEKGLSNLYDISTAQSGNDALAALKANPPDMILLDVMMPDVSGFDVCQIIKEFGQYADIPILFITALDSLEAEIRGLELGGVDYLTKPFNIDLVLLKVRNHIETKKRNDLIRQQKELLSIQKEELEAALSRVKMLEGIIPICMYCKKIRNDNQSWQQMEAYISEHSLAHFSHGICPECGEKKPWLE